MQAVLGLSVPHQPSLTCQGAPASGHSDIILGQKRDVGSFLGVLPGRLCTGGSKTKPPALGPLPVGGPC